MDMDNINFFETNKSEQLNKNMPLATRMRPENIDDFVGQGGIIGEGKPLNRMIKADKITSMILYGPTGSGKTTLANIIAKTTKMDFTELSATASGVKDIKEVIEKATQNLSLYSRRTVLFIDEIHRFNKAQQDTLLPHVENGLIVLIGATTENPYFEVNKALLSRSVVLTFERLSNLDMDILLTRALTDKVKGYGNYNIRITEDAKKYLFTSSSGDGRVLLNNLEIAILSTNEVNGVINIGIDEIKNSIVNKNIYYGKNEDEHYNNISAFIKSMRGSDPDASIYYLSKMLLAGEDLKFIGRRIMIFAAEDIGLADPNAINIANSTFQAISVVGNPESRIILANAAIYMSLAPKSNSAYLAINKAMEFIKQNKEYEIPKYLRDSNAYASKDTQYLYKYPHMYTYGWVEQDYLPDEIKNQVFYYPKEIGYEKRINDRLNSIKNGGNDGNKKTV